MNRRAQILLAVTTLFAVVACDNSSSTAPDVISGAYSLVSENGQTLPADPNGPDGCCLTLGGSITFSGDDRYDLRTSHRNKNTQVAFDNSEVGTYVRDGNRLTFTRTGGGGVNQAYLLAPATFDGATITLLYGDEGPGSNQVRAVFVQLR